MVILLGGIIGALSTFEEEVRDAALSRHRCLLEANNGTYLKDLELPIELLDSLLPYLHKCAQGWKTLLDKR